MSSEDELRCDKESSQAGGLLVSYGPIGAILELR